MTNDDEKKVYGSYDDMADAVKFLSAIKNDSSLLKETITSHLLNKFRKLAEVIMHIFIHANCLIQYFISSRLRIVTDNLSQIICPQDFLKFYHIIVTDNLSMNT